MTSIEIPSSVTKIGDHAFEGCLGLTSIIIPNSVTRIFECAFGSCEALTSIVLPSSVKILKRTAFDGCISLQNIIVDDKNEEFSSQDGVLFNKDKTKLERCPEGKIDAYIIPNSVVEIENYAFSGCTGLISIEIPKSVQKLPYNCFYQCENLREIHIKHEHPEELDIDDFYCDYPFEGLEGCILYVPIGTGYAYRHDERFRAFMDIKIEI